MALNRDKFRKIVGGITTPPPDETPTEETPTKAQATAEIEAARPETPEPAPTGQGSNAAGHQGNADYTTSNESRRFAKRGRPKGRQEEAPAGKQRKVKVSLFLSEVLVNDLYDWAHADRIHPGEMFELALRPFHEKETKRRNAGKG